MNLFGTDGIRAKVGTFPLTVEDLSKLAKAIGHFASSNYENAKILIAHDTRSSSALIKSILKSSLLQNKVHIYDAQVLPTPACYNLTYKQKLFDLAIVITASHNPYHDNGIKIIDRKNGKLSSTDEQIITKSFFENNFDSIDYNNLGSDSFYIDAPEKYIKDILQYFDATFLKDMTIALDCANGATSAIAQIAFEKLGANVIAINNQPDGKNINLNCGSTHPNALRSLVINSNADIGFAFDGDGDRIIAVNKDGVIKDGDDILALLIDLPIYNQDKIVSTIVANYGFENYLKKKYKKLLRTPVGDKYVAKELVKENLKIGGEPSGHIILNDYLNTSDSIFTALRMLQTIKLTNNWQMKTFEKFPQFSLNLPILDKKDLSLEPYKTIISDFENKINGRIIVRYSGTEPLLRIVVESQNFDIAKKTANDLAHELNLIFQLNEKEINHAQKQIT